MVKDSSRYMYSLQITYSVSLIESLFFFVRIVTSSEECKMLNRLAGVVPVVTVLSTLVFPLKAGQAAT